MMFSLLEIIIYMVIAGFFSGMVGYLIGFEKGIENKNRTSND